MDPTELLAGLDTETIRRRRAYAIRQFAWFQALVTIRTAEGKTDAANGFAFSMAECNDYINAANERLGDSL